MEALYASITEGSKWTEAIHGLTQWIGGNAAFHLVTDARTHRVIETQGIGVPREFVDAFEANFLDKETRIAYAVKRPAGEALVDYSFIDLNEFRCTEIYNELLLPFDAPYLMVAWLEKSSEALISLSIEAGLRQGPFEAEQVGKFGRVLPHLLRVLQTRQLLRKVHLNDHFTRRGLTALPFGMLLLDRSGAVVETTPVAEEILREGSTLKYRHGRVHAVGADDDRLLQAAIAKINRSDAAGTNLKLHRITHSLPLTLMIMPVSMPEFLQLLPRPACLIVIVDPERKVRANVELLQRALNLSHAESTLAFTLFEGRSLMQAAAHLGRSYNTCKTQMKAIYAKTGCDSQADLIKKIMLVTLVPTESTAADHAS